MLRRTQALPLLLGILFCSFHLPARHQESHVEAFVAFSSLVGRRIPLPPLRSTRIRWAVRDDRSAEGNEHEPNCFPENVQPSHQLAASLAPKSRMNDYVNDFLDKNVINSLSSSKNVDGSPCIDNAEVVAAAQLDDIAHSTHLIAIPMEQSHELLLELESVQRAILHYCPILLDACIAPGSTRLPLLYVQATEQNSARTTLALGKLVSRLVRRHIYKREDPSSDKDKDTINEEGYRPITMTFQSLEIEGDNNSILSTVGVLEDESRNDDLMPESATSLRRFNDFVQDLQCAIASEGWKMAFPPDANKCDDQNKHSKFRPRVAFMELPTSFDENLSRYKSIGKEIKKEDMEFLTSEKGGNGISPIFWCQWWDDVFARNVRMREIAVYPRNLMNAGDGSDKKLNSQYYLPYETIPLPDGSPSMLRSEKTFQQYQERRMEEEQDRVSRANAKSDGQAPQKSGFSSVSSSDNTSEPDIVSKKTRERLERIYLESSGVTSRDFVENVDQGDEQAAEDVDGLDVDTDEDLIDLKVPNHPIRPQADDYMEDWMKLRIRKAVNSLESVKSRNPIKKDVPPIENNPVFKAYKEGTLIPKVEKPKPKVKKSGPYPGNDHFVGIWKTVSSPIGVEVDDSSQDTSENLILRVDGTTAGGPTLDPETRQKAAGGTWKILPQENGDVLLRIRLVIPPEKKQILVMEGIVHRMGSEPSLPTPSRTFGIPEVEDRAKKAREVQTHLLTCSGEVHIEDAVTRKNQELIGRFSLMKLQGPKDETEYTITVPRSVRNIE